MIRSLRGWCLGNQNLMRERRNMRKSSLDCPCTYSHPYLHSLVKTWVHWDGPVARQPRGHALCFGSPGLDYRVASPYGNELLGNVLGGLGYFSYKPGFIERMGKWDHVGVLGVVSNFGIVMEHEFGYRADIVRIDHLWVLRTENIRFNHEKLQSFLENTYQCGVVLLDSGIVDSFVTWLKKEDVENLL